MARLIDGNFHSVKQVKTCSISLFYSNNFYFYKNFILFTVIIYLILLNYLLGGIQKVWVCTFEYVE